MIGKFNVIDPDAGYYRIVAVIEVSGKNPEELWKAAEKYKRSHRMAGYDLEPIVDVSMELF